jgi:hypothetical protein
MSTNSSPVSQLFNLGRPADRFWVDYKSLGLGTEHIFELLQLLKHELAWGDSDKPEVYVALHALRALGQFKVEAAIEPLLDLLGSQEEEETWIDWITEDVPDAIGMIGPSALAKTAQRLEQSLHLEFVPTFFAEALVQIAKQHPSERSTVVSYLTAALKSAETNSISANTLIMSGLVALYAKEAWPVIEMAFMRGRIDESMDGNAQWIKSDLGLAPLPMGSRRPGFFTGKRPTPVYTPKERADERARKRKAAKRQAKRK